MVTSKETAEEQLLKMIEGPHGSRDVEQPTTARAARRPHATAFVRALTERVRRVLLPERREADVFLWNLRVAQRVLWAGLVGLGAYTLASILLFQPAHRARVMVATPLRHASALSASPPDARPLKPLAEYVATVAQHNPFTGVSSLLSLPTAHTAKHRLEELAGNFVVVGVDRGATPIALIEQKNPQRTYMVKVGDDLGGLTVKQISSEGIVVSYEGEELGLP